MQIILIIDKFTERVGCFLSYLCLLMMLITSLNVALRYLFDLNFIALQESITYLHGAIFMLGAGYALQCESHVRVDIFYQKMSLIQQAWINSLGILVLLLPFCVLLGILSWSFFLDAWAYKEGSPEPGGLPFVYLLKLLIPLMSVLLTLQATALFFKHARLLVFPQESN